MKTIDFAPYVTPPHIGATSGLVLGVRLIRVVETLALPDQVKAPLGELHAAAERLQAAVRGRQRRSKGSKAEDLNFDASWSGLYGRIHAWTRTVHAPEAPEATALLTTLFPTGMAWLRASHEEEWVHSRALLQRIEQEGHTASIVNLADPRWLDMVKDAHQALGEALGLEGETNTENEPSLAVGAEVRALAEAIAAYGRIFAGTVVDDASLAVFEAAMRPLDAHRDRHRRRSSAQADEQGDEFDEFDEFDQFDVDEPLPPLPDPD